MVVGEISIRQLWGFFHSTRIWYSLIQSAKLHGLNTTAYLTDILTRLPAGLYKTIDDLLPHKWQAYNPYESSSLETPIIVKQLLMNFQEPTVNTT